MAVRVDQATLVGGAVSTLTFTGAGNKVRVTILDAVGGPVYFSVGSTANPPPDPTVAGDDFDAVPNIIGGTRTAYGSGSAMTTVVKLISAGTPVVSVDLLGD